MATARSLCQRNPSPAAVVESLPSNRDENEKMKRIEAKFQVVTPCFLGGANHEKEAELRLSSIKGVLRFWWRALNYAQITKGATNPNETIENLREKEGKLFGSSDLGKGQSSLIMRLNAESQKPSEIKARKVLCDENGKKVGDGARYLGYGVMETIGNKKKGTKAGELTRHCLTGKGKRGDSFCPFEFALQIGAKKQEHLDEILPVLKLFGLLGGIGSKSRKGYGSLNLIKLKVNGIDAWQKPADEDDYENRLIDLLKPVRGYGEEPKISAFSSKTCICLTQLKHKTSMEAIDSYGQEMQDFRRDKKGKAVFGLPQGRVSPKKYDRRASPLFFHVHKIGGEYVGVALLLRSQFLPKSEKILANRKPVPANPDWKVLTDFLGRICDKTIWP